MKAINDSLPSIRSIIDSLTDCGKLSPADALNIEQHMHATRPAASSEPAFVRLLMATGAWVAAACFVSFLAIANLLQETAGSLGAWAVVFLVAAVGLRAWTERLFPRQLSLALSVAGQGLALAAVGEAGGSSALLVVALTSILMCLTLYPLYRDWLHRFLSVLLATACTILWIVMDDMWGVFYILLTVQIAVIRLVFVRMPEQRSLRPLGFAFAIAVPASMLLVLLPQEAFDWQWWPVRILLAYSLIWLFQWIVGGWAAMRSEPMIIAVVSTLLLATFSTPGILAALGLMVLGYARRESELTGLGILFFPVFIVVFYFEWETSLLTKSWILAGSGSVLLVARYYLSLRSWAREGDQ